MAGESTRLFYGDKKTTRVVRKVLDGARRIDMFADSAAPAVLTGVEPLKERVMSMIKAGGKILGSNNPGRGSTFSSTLPIS